MHKIMKAIYKGNLDQLKKYLDEDPAALRMSFGSEFWGYPELGLLHLAAYFDQPEIVKFLVGKGLDINKKYYMSTPLHYAAEQNSYKAVDALLSLGANPRLTNKDGKAPYDLAAKAGIRDLLLDAYNVAARKQESAEQEKEKSVEAEQVTAAVQPVESGWKLGSDDDEIIFERDMPEQKLRLTETFNFAADLRILIVKNLENGALSQPETKLLSEIPKRADQARTEFDKLKKQGNNVLINKSVLHH